MNADKKTFVVAEVKSAESDNPNGEFEVILSAETLDRDGEVIDSKAFEPLPESVPFHAFHDFHDPIGRGVPYYDGNILKARGTFASTARAQEIRTLVAEGVIGHTSVGFMAATRKGADDDTPHVTSGELLEGSFVSVPSNREAAVLLVKGFDAGAGAVTKEGDRLQAIHDLAVSNGAQCAGHSKATEVPEPETPAAPLEVPPTPATDAPVPPATDVAGKAPASTVVELARLRAELALLTAPRG
jgi:HK97 family phage prohead protease